MKCPHCLTAFYGSWTIRSLASDKDAGKMNDHALSWKVRFLTCPQCSRVVVELGTGFGDGNDWRETKRLVRPTGITREPLSPEVPIGFATDYLEAVAVFNDSPKASAALSRRCLQHLIREKAQITRKTLDQEIQTLIDTKTLPSHLADAIDSVRNIGNFAAHPMKSTSTGEIMDVEPGEAEWNLDTLEGLFDFYFVEPARLQKKKDALNQKLADAGKPLMK